MGDLSVSVPEREEGHEIDRLSRAFNRMTAQLASQRAELISANNQLDERRRFTETVIGGVSAGVLGLDHQGRITLPNRSAADLIKAAPDELIGRPLIAVIPEVGGLLAHVATAPERPAEAQIELKRPDGSHTLLVRVAAQHDAQGIGGYVVTFDDITELLAAQRKAAWAEIARRIAHEIKNPLTPIRLSAERLRRKYLPQIKDGPDAFANSTDTIIRQVDSIGRLINEFSAFARMPAPIFAYRSGKDLVRQAVYLQQGARPGIRFETRLPEGEVQLYCDAQQVAQALTNLLQNAVEAVLERMEQQEGSALGHGRARRDARAVPDRGARQWRRAARADRAADRAVRDDAPLRHRPGACHRQEDHGRTRRQLDPAQPCGGRRLRRIGVPGLSCGARGGGRMNSTEAPRQRSALPGSVSGSEWRQTF